jgi:hypothetical protein
MAQAGSIGMRKRMGRTNLIGNSSSRASADVDSLKNLEAASIMKKLVFSVLILGVLIRISYGAPFQNLGFDEANTNTSVFSNYPLSSGITPTLYGGGPAQDLLTGWQLFQNGTLLANLGYDLRADEIAPSLLSRDAFPSVQGKYALRLWLSDSIAQRGDIPADASLITFQAGGLPFFVSVNGVDLPNPFVIPPTSPFFSYDISAYAGQNVELGFRPFRPVMTENPYGRIDSISFVVPEPNAYALFVLGAVGFLSLGMRRRLHR